MATQQQELDYRAMTTLEGVSKQCRTLAGIHELIAARRGHHRLPEFAILSGQVHLMANGATYQIVWRGKSPAERFGTRLKRVMPFADFEKLNSRRADDNDSYHTSSVCSIAPDGGACDLCGGTWTIHNCLDYVEVDPLAEGMAPRHYHPRCWQHVSLVVKHANHRSYFREAGANHGSLTPLPDKQRPTDATGQWFALKTHMGTFKVGSMRFAPFAVEWSDTKYRLDHTIRDHQTWSADTMAAFGYEHDYIRWLSQLVHRLELITEAERARDRTAA